LRLFRTFRLGTFINHRGRGRVRLLSGSFFHLLRGLGLRRLIFDNVEESTAITIATSSRSTVIIALRRRCLGRNLRWCLGRRSLRRSYSRSSNSWTSFLLCRCLSSFTF
jgi:hypothetical protein